MATILPESREENVVASLFKYVEANFTLVPVYYGIAGIKEEDLDEWIRVDVMIPKPRYARQVGDGKMGAEALVMLNINIFKKGVEAESVNIYRSYRIRDTIANLFRVPLGVAVMDYVESDGAGTNRIGTLQTSELDSTNLGWVESQAVYQWNLTSTMRYVQAWEAPS